MRASDDSNGAERDHDSAEEGPSLFTATDWALVDAAGEGGPAGERAREAVLGGLAAVVLLCAAMDAKRGGCEGPVRVVAFLRAQGWEGWTRR